MSEPKKIRSWSYSRLLDFEACPFKAKLKIIDKIPEPERELPPGKTEHANDRGTRIHLECENFVKGQGPFPKEMKHFEAELKSVQARYKQCNVSCTCMAVRRLEQVLSTTRCGGLARSICTRRAAASTPSERTMPSSVPWHANHTQS